jgi:uncharacterized protein YjbJ (UPF0337 family)
VRFRTRPPAGLLDTGGKTSAVATQATVWNGERPHALIQRYARRNRNEDTMNKDRIEGSMEQAKGKVKEVTGKITGDSKLEIEGKADQVAGKMKSTVGGIKDAIKEAADH